ncbi:MAG: hypothetical protein KJ970_11950 [Candidatus Eisenbacteria bacterium]|uniref:FlgD/Vpr Ig-like domain-containing protein n=1 Tax=Eiseniibacteriota bacterium TaxID=2212470 RepID=A0A948W6L2_UNCEI|nr:hypothetical protein [Candidatus Eisenbacteria bacterium]MBU1949452.1 hypothetical protein [Candidatus Eisenbacteria bacterium]MBU2691629.1 hypothetical protein [Candidatus Eisenbacteria bacterium]
MKNLIPGLILLAFAAFVSLAPCQAQWSQDAGVNLAIADRPSDQVTPKVAGTSTGGCYVAWFDLASGSYDVYLQHLDAEGFELWAHNGLLISDHPQMTWLVDWDLIADSNDNAIVLFSDIRDGADLDVYAYKIAPNGGFLWGTDGKTISENNDFEPAPRVVESSNGDLVFVWSRQPDEGDGALMMQRLSPDGTELFAHGGIPIVTVPGEDPGFCEMVPSENGNVIVSWVKDISTFYSDRYVMAEEFTAAGTSAWGGSVSVFDATIVPIAHTPRILSDGDGGAIVYWHRSLSDYFNSFVQHLDTNGSEIFPHNGLSVSTTAGYHHIDPTVSYNTSTGEIYVFWDERNSNQSQWGVYGQLFSADGARLWGAGGFAFEPVNTTYKLAIRSVPVADDAMVFWIDEPTGTYGQNRVVGFRTDRSGVRPWGDPPIEVSSHLSSKSGLPLSMDHFGVVKLIWEDGRNGAPDIYGQNVNFNGTLGLCACTVDNGVADMTRLALNTVLPNPFSERAVLNFQLPRTADIHLAVYDLGGRRIATLVDGRYPAGSYNTAWLGLNDSGERVPSGLYFGRLISEGMISTKKIVYLK